MVPVKDEEDGLRYLIQDLDRSGIGRNMTYLSYSSLMRELKITHGISLLECQNKLWTRGFTWEGDAIKRAINNLEGGQS